LSDLFFFDRRAGSATSAIAHESTRIRPSYSVGTTTIHRKPTSSRAARPGFRPH